MPDFRNVTFDEIELGKPVSFTRTLTRTEVDALALASGDLDPFHLDDDEAKSPVSAVPVAQAVGAALLVSGMLNRRMPGPGSVVMSEELEYRGKVAVGDQLTATITAREKRREGNIVLFDCVCENQDGERIVRGTATVRAPTRRILYSDLATPEIVVRHGDVFARLLKRCEGLPAVSCAVVHPCDHDSLAGPLEAAKRGLIAPVLVGPQAKIRAVAKTHGLDLGSHRIVDTEHSHDAATKAVAMARAGEVESLMKGSLHTDELMAAVVPSATGLRTARRVSHVFVIDVPSYPRMLLVTDAAINIYPTLDDKADIAQNAIELARVLGIAEPKVAILSAVETVNAKIQSTLDAAALCKMADRGQISGGVLDGPLAFDNAVSEQAAKTKKIVSPVAGRADILLVPDLEAGNMVAKQLQYLAGAESAGIVLGTRVPIVLTSRADTVRTRLASTAVMKLVAAARREKAPAAGKD
jgi:phosphate acetyltransferase